MKHIVGALALAAGLMVGTQAQALSITPADAVLSGNDTGQAAIDAIVLPFIFPATELYKQDVGGGESGALAGSYETEFFNTPSDPEDATITYVGGNIVGPTAWLLVKDGNQEPAWYLFNLTDLGWDGMETLELMDFWPDEGAISHVSLYGTQVPPPPPDDVPEPTMLVLLGVGLLGAGFARRRLQ